MKKIPTLTNILFLTLPFLFFNSQAEETTGVEKMPIVQEFIKNMNEKYDFSVDELNGIFSKVTLREIVVQKVKKPAEAMTWARYQKIFLTETRIKNGAQFIADNLDLLNRASEEFGVPIEIITAVLGVETNYGETKGNYLAINAIASLAFQTNRRQKFFTSELEHLLLMSKEEKIDIENLKGSYAGALGIAQFIPSSYRRLSIDYDGDNSRDLIYSKADAVGSVGHYFKEHNWEKNAPVAEKLNQEIDHKHTNTKAFKPKKSLQYWENLGIYANHYDKSELGRVVSFDGQDGLENWMIYPNFYTITRYNHSKLYAMAVFQLSEAIKNSYQENLALAKTN